MAYDLHGIDPGRLYASYFAGDGGLVVEADEKARGCWLKHLPEDVIIGCPAREGQHLGGEGVSFSFDLARRRRTSPRLRFCFWGGRSAFRASIVPPHLSQLGP
jgi:hypothetical protein